jgi:3-phenylpropionate/trans-cinnamate dioxygenase ferredoxin subunit
VSTVDSKLRFACRVDDLAAGKSLSVPGEPAIALYRNDDGEFYATADRCTHEEWSLGEDGDLEGDEIVCPLHMARFDIRSGKALCFPATVDLRTFDVVVRDGDVFVVE